MDMSEYIQYETGDIASGPEINHFNSEIDKIRSDVDRAEARLNRLLESQNSNEKAATK